MSRRLAAQRRKRCPPSARVHHAFNQDGLPRCIFTEPVEVIEEADRGLQAWATVEAAWSALGMMRRNAPVWHSAKEEATRGSPDWTLTARISGILPVPGVQCRISMCGKIDHLKLPARRTQYPGNLTQMAHASLLAGDGFKAIRHLGHRAAPEARLDEWRELCFGHLTRFRATFAALPQRRNLNGKLPDEHLSATRIRDALDSIRVHALLIPGCAVHAATGFAGGLLVMYRRKATE